MKDTTIRRMLAASMAVCCIFGSTSLTASAYTADDVAARARASGWPEYLIQAGYNEWSSGNYTQDQLDQAYASVIQYDEQTGQLIANSLGVRYKGGDTQTTTEAPANTATEAQTGAATGSENARQPAADPGSSPSAPAATEAAPETPAAPITVTKNDGTTEERITQTDFVNMTLDEKREYINSLTEDSQDAFMDSLTTAERNSILKQLPAEEKAELIQSYVDAAGGMGLNVSVDSINGSDVSMTIRNDDGQVVGKTAIGTIIDETGISHTGAYLLALCAALGSLLGFALLYRYIRRSE